MKTGRHVSLGRALDTVAGLDNGRPALHYMTSLGDTGEDASSYNCDFIGVDFHGKSATTSTPCRMSLTRAFLYNGKRANQVVGSKGSSFAPVSAWPGASSPEVSW